MMQQHQRFQQQRHYHQHHQQQQQIQHQHHHNQHQHQHQHHPRNHHQHHQQQQQQHPKVLDKNIQNALNQLVDRLNTPDPHIYTILVGTSDGVGLARAHGTNSNHHHHHHPSATQSQSQSLSSSSSNFSEEILSGMERIWATLPSGSGHYLKPLKLGDTVKTVTAFYENCTLVHCYKSPLVSRGLFQWLHAYIYIYVSIYIYIYILL